MQRRLFLSNVVDVTLFTDSEADFVRINDIDTTEEMKGTSDVSPWSGQCFAETAQCPRAEVKDDYGFARFVVADLVEDTTVEYRGPATKVTLGSADTKAEAVFEQGVWKYPTEDLKPGTVCDQQVNMVEHYIFGGIPGTCLIYLRMELNDR